MINFMFPNAMCARKKIKTKNLLKIKVLAGRNKPTIQYIVNFSPLHNVSAIIICVTKRLLLHVALYENNVSIIHTCTVVYM